MAVTLPTSIPLTIFALSMTTEVWAGALPMTSKAAGQAPGALWLPGEQLD